MAGAYSVGEKDITSAGTPEALTTQDVTCESVAITGKSTNTGAVYVTDPENASNTFLLRDGSTITLPVKHPALIMIDVDTNGEGVHWMAV